MTAYNEGDLERLAKMADRQGAYEVAREIRRLAQPPTILHYEPIISAIQVATNWDDMLVPLSFGPPPPTPAEGDALTGILNRRKKERARAKAARAARRKQRAR